MKWVVLAIAIFIAGYTYLTLRFRKPGREYRPYEDMRRRANTLRLLDTGYRRVTLPAEQPAAPLGRPDTTYAAPGGLPSDLDRTIVSRPRLPSRIIAAYAAPSASRDAPYEIEFRCILPNDNRQLAGAELYLKGDKLVVTPDLDVLAPGLRTRTRELLVLLTVPAGTLKPGTYYATLVGTDLSRDWTVRVK